LRSITFTTLLPRESRRRLDLTELLQVHAVVARLQAPPLAEIHLAEPEMLEGEPHCASRSIDPRVRSRVAFIVAISSPIDLP
jgi:hypothetical protein